MRKFTVSAQALIVALSLAGPAFAAGYDPTSGTIGGNADRGYDPTGGVQTAYVGRPYDPTRSADRDSDMVARRNYDPTFVERQTVPLVTQSIR